MSGEQRTGPLGLFEGFGIEIEYMIVDRETLDVRPVADELLKAAAGEYTMEVDHGAIGWSNELALHVVELKTGGPVASLAGVESDFQAEVREIDGLLAPMGARLLPGGMHPWMAEDELRLWPFGDDLIYSTLHRIFDCRGHGWSNLQSMHVNLPFANDAEFERLHAAIRLVLPLLPALAASSPFVDGTASGLIDTRLDVYRHNARKVPSVTGRVIPEPLFCRADYERMLEGIYRDLSGQDPDGVLQHEWINARGCIARFDRMALEIRVIDAQECPRMDLAIAAAAVAVVEELVAETWIGLEEQRAWSEQALEAIFVATLRDGERTRIDDAAFARAFGFGGRGPIRAGDLWAHIVERSMASHPARSWAVPALTIPLEQGCLGRRILTAAGENPSRGRLLDVYSRLADCLGRGEPFTAD